MSERTTATHFDGKGQIGLRTERYATLLPIGHWVTTLLIATRFGWKPTGTSEPGGWVVTDVAGTFKAASGSYAMHRPPDPAPVVGAADALALSLALSAALAGDTPKRAADTKPLLLGASTEQNASCVDVANGSDWSALRPTMMRVARLAWRGSFQIVPAWTVVSGLELIP